MTYTELHEEICTFAWGLKSLGAQKGQTLCLFSENSARWLVADQGSSMVGCSNALRGITSPPEELGYIVDNSQGKGLIVQVSTRTLLLSFSLSLLPLPSHSL